LWLELDYSDQQTIAVNGLATLRVQYDLSSTAKRTETFELTVEPYRAFHVSPAAVAWHKLDRSTLDTETRTILVRGEDEPNDTLSLHFDAQSFAVTNNRLSATEWLISITPLPGIAAGPFCKELRILSARGDGASKSVSVVLSGDVRETHFAVPSEILAGARFVGEKVPLSVFIGHAGGSDAFRVNSVRVREGSASLSRIETEQVADGAVCRFSLHCDEPGQRVLSLDFELITDGGDSSLLQVPARMLAIPTPSWGSGHDR
jgi:hypothetical protein